MVAGRRRVKYDWSHDSHFGSTNTFSLPSHYNTLLGSLFFFFPFSSAKNQRTEIAYPPAL